MKGLLNVLPAAFLLLVATLLPTTTEAQTRPLRGLVTGDGQPVNAAAISVQGTGITTFTGQDGRFTLEVPQGEVTVVVQRIGFRTAEVVVPGTQSEIDVTLQTDYLRLSEIVVTGRATGTQRQNLPHAVASINQDQLNRLPSGSMEQQLYGKVAGANIQSNTAAPGGGMQLRLRGPSTFIGAHTPLYVIDGVIVNDGVIPSGVHQVTVSSSNPERGGSQDNSPNRIADLNPNDIESIEILKGASAAAIYGSKASNGVVIITTRSGEAGAPRYNVRQRFGVSVRSNQLGFRRFQTLEDAVDAFGPTAADYWEPGRYFDHEDALAGETPLSWEFSGSVSGGTPATRYFLSILSQDEGGILTNTGYQKQSLRLNLNQSIHDRLTLDVNTNVIRSNTARGFTQNDNRSISYWMTFPSTPSFVDLRRRADGTFPDNPFSRSNPLQTAALSVNDEIVSRFIGVATATFTAFSSPSNELRLVGTAGADYFSQKNEVFTPPDLQFEPLDGLPGTSLLGQAESQNTNLSLNAVHTLTPESNDFSFTTSVGAQRELRDVEYSRTTARNLVGGLSNVGKGTALSVFSRRERVVDVGFFVQEDVLINQRLLLSGSVRGERSSNNALTSETFWYPKVAASFRFPDLPIDQVDEVKLRLAMGESGNQPRFGQKFTEYLGQNIEGLTTFSVSGTTAAADLRPERQREIEGGIDLALFGERATLELTAFQQNITDVLLQRQLPTSSGFSTAIINSGEIRVRGAEASLFVIPIAREGFEWTSRINWSMDRSEILELGVPPFVTGGFGFLFGAFFAEEGGSMTAIWGNKTLPDGSVVNAKIGDATPDFRMGLSNDVRFGNFHLGGVLDWQKGSDVINLTQLLIDLAGNSVDCDVMAEGSDQSVCARRLGLWPSETSVYVEDASFIKLRELTLGYDVPERLRAMIPGNTRNARITLSARNLLRITDYTGMDPEVSNFGSQAVGRNVDVAPYPPSRSFWLSMDIGF